MIFFCTGFSHCASLVAASSAAEVRSSTFVSGWWLVDWRRQP
jgi:hypothetical protein